MASRLDAIQRASASYIEELYARYRDDPASVPEDWAVFFAGFELAHPPEGEGRPAGGVFGLVQHHRVFGHLAAWLDPLSERPACPPLLDPATLGFGEADLGREVDWAPFRPGTKV